MRGAVLMYAITFIIASLASLGAVVVWYVIEDELKQIRLKRCADRALKQFYLRETIKQRNRGVVI